ncbi:MAG: hypothetical protein E7428_02185 [Ruminococcaceae bacterium]|nr:hypothetical protein [Oscillospiraceae bacterium]
METILIALPNRHAVAIASNSAPLIDTLLSDYAPHCRRASDSEESGLPTLILAAQDGGFVVTEGEAQRFTDSPFQEVSDFISRTLAGDTSLFMLHGAALEYKGEAHLFLAVSGSGKTTLATYLCEEGFPYMAEDCIYLDRGSLMVLPHYRPIHMREGGLDVLHRLGMKPQSRWDPMLERHVIHPERVCDKPLPIKRMYFIERSESENRMLPLSVPERIQLLLHAPRVAYPMNREYLTFLMGLAQADCRRLIYRDLDFVKFCLQN